MSPERLFGPTAPAVKSKTSVPAVPVPNETIRRSVPGIRAVAGNVAALSRVAALCTVGRVLTAEPVPNRETTRPPLDLSKLRPKTRKGGGRDVFHAGPHDLIAGEPRLGVGVERGGGAQGESGEGDGAESADEEAAGGDHDVVGGFGLLWRCSFVVREGWIKFGRASGEGPPRRSLRVNTSGRGEN